MRLIDVQFFLGFEEGILPPNTKPLAEFTGSLLANTKYAILSHCWGPPEEEVQFMDMEGIQNIAAEELRNITTMDRDKLRSRKGYWKILGSCQKARGDNIRWVWVDTCCIDKRSSSELHDVRSLEFPKKQEDRFEAFNGWPMWFSRGWTLQELVAPSDVHFFHQKWNHIGSKNTLARELSRITKIPDHVLTDGLSPWRRPSVAQIMSWAANRRTTREEDRAYSLLGMLGVHMPMLYGEGKHAFRRLQEEIIRRLNDQTIFAWGWSAKAGWSKNFLADDPICFLDCDRVLAMKRNEFVDTLLKEIPQEDLDKFPPEHLRTFNLSNDGIQIWVPIIPCRGSTWLYKARLPCRLSDSSSPLSITLGCFDSNYFRYFGNFEADPFAQVKLQQVFLPYQENVDKDEFTFRLELRTLSYAGFAQPVLFPRHVQSSDTSITLSKASDCAVLVYCCSDSIFLTVVLRHCLGEHSVQVICEESNSSWLEYARRAHQRTQDETLAEAAHISEAWSSVTSPVHSQLLKRVHIPRSIQDVRLLYTRALQPGSCTVIADVVECTGCCRPTWEVVEGKFIALPHVPGFMRDAVGSHRHNSYEFLVNSHRTRFLSTDVLANDMTHPGDYGRVGWNGPFEREGNIFKHAATLGLNMPHRCVELGIGDGEGAYTKADAVKVSGRIGNLDSDRVLVLRNAVLWSLPSTEEVFSLIAALSAHLPGRCLVTTVMRCSEICIENPDPGGSQLEKCDTPSHLYTLMTPSAWHRPNAHEETMIQFQNIDQYIDKLLILGDNRQEGDEEEKTIDKRERKEEKGKKKKESEARKEREASIMFFADMFGRKSLQNMVGNISFFSAFASLVTSAEAVKPTLGESGLSAEGMNDRIRPYPSLRRPFAMPWKGRTNLHIQRHTQFSGADRHSPDTRIEVDGVQNSRIHVSRRTLIKDSTHAAVEGVTDLASTRGTGARQISEELGSKSFGPQLLRLIGTIYMKSESILAFDNSGSDGTSPEEDFAVVYSSTLKSRLRVLLKRVDKLRCHLRTSKNDGEVQRALTEDIAGTILLLCWQGVRCEVKQVLTKAVDAVVNDKLVDRGTREARAKRLRNIGEMFVQNATDRASEYGSCALQRTFIDAEAGISKYDLLLAARKLRSELPAK